jgi:hypothetical protein
MGLRIWLDDVRPMPNMEGFNCWCKTAKEFVSAIKFSELDYISFDHDLGSEEGLDGYWVAVYIETLAAKHRIGRVGWDVHSANPPGRKNIEAAMTSAERFWNIK